MCQTKAIISKNVWQYCCKNSFKIVKTYVIYFVCKMPYQIINDNLFFGPLFKLIIFYPIFFFSEEFVISISNIQCTHGMMHGVFGQNGGVYTFATK